MRSQNAFFKGSMPVALLAASVLIALAAFFSVVNPVGAQTVVGSTQISGALVGLGGADVNPNTDRVYVQWSTNNFDNTITVINASDKTNPIVVTTIGGNAAGLTANSVTNRFYTTDGYGGNIRVFDGATNSLIATVFKGYCHAAMDTNETANLIYSVSQCGGFNDPVQVLNGATNTIVGGPLGTGGVAGGIKVNPATGRVYAFGSFTRVWGPSPSFSFIGDLPGFIRAVNPVTNRLYFGSGPDLQVRDGNTHAVLATIAGSDGLADVDTGLNRVYIANSGVLKVIDGATNTVLSTFSLGPGVTTSGQPAVDSVKHRIYVVGHVSGTTRLYVIEDAMAPVANAGPDQTVNENTLVTLDGTGSTGGTLTYQWTQISGTPVSLSSATAAQPTFTAPQVSTAGETLTFQLVVNNGQQNSQPDTVNIMVKNVNKVPVCDAGPSQMVNENGTAMLDGSGSFDPDGEPLTYQWTQTAGTAVSLSSATVAKPTFTAPIVGPTGETLSFQLTVSDGTASTSCGTTVQVINVNQKPVANAGPDQTKGEGTLVSLNGTGSMDPDGDALTYAWSQVSGPTVLLSDPSSATPSFTAPAVNPGGETLVFQLVVHDGQLPSDPDTVVITIQNVNDPPVCSLAQPNPASLWPPNHGMVPVSITNVADANNDQVVIMVTGVTQDEPVDGLGDGDTSPDAVLQGNQALVRAERSGTGNGRVYEVHFTASDGQATGGSCSGSVKVSVPHSKKSTAVDDGQLYNSTLP